MLNGKGGGEGGSACRKLWERPQKPDSSDIDRGRRGTPGDT